MESRIKTYEIQFDTKPSGAVVKINDENGCVLRICGIPKKMVFEPSGEVKPYIDITHPKRENKQKSAESIALNALKQGDVFYTVKHDKDITAIASFYGKKVSTERLITINPISAETQRIVKVTIL